MHGELGNSYIIGVGSQYVSCLINTGHPQEIVESALPKGVGKQLGIDSPVVLLRLLIALFVLICLCACLGCGGYGYRRRYVIRRVEYVQPTTTVVAPAAGRLYRS